MKVMERPYFYISCDVEVELVILLRCFVAVLSLFFLSSDLFKFHKLMVHFIIHNQTNIYPIRLLFPVFFYNILRRWD